MTLWADHGGVVRRPLAMKQKPQPRLNRKKAKTVLRLPDLEFAKEAVLDTLTSRDAQRGYRHAIDEFVDWYCSEPRLACGSATASCPALPAADTLRRPAPSPAGSDRGVPCPSGRPPAAATLRTRHSARNPYVPAWAWFRMKGFLPRWRVTRV